MLFNSIEFLIFFPLVFIFYWFVFKRSIRGQNLLILVSSYVFYGWWDYRFLGLIALSTLIDFFVGLRIEEQSKLSLRKVWLIISVVFNLGILIFFKYYNFFIDSWVDAFSKFGYELDTWTVSVILPVGISFYTFQTMSYTIDIYRRNLKPTKDLLAFGAFVSFFPQLVAGPIERATNLLPQFFLKRSFNYKQALSGSRLVLWGLVKKVVFADSLAPAVNEIFSNYLDYSSGTLILGVVYFAFQIYCDFSGYSDIARGVARIFGFNLMVNFDFPYFAQSIADFWRRWHISLSTWFRDYLYIPLGGSHVSKLRGIFNVSIVFMVSGLWHGANWTFIAWGAIHALFFVPSFITGNNKKFHKNIFEENKYLPPLKGIANVLLTFVLVCIAWVFFRAESLSHALGYLSQMASFDLFPDKRWYLYFYVLPFVFLEVLKMTCVFYNIRFKTLRMSIYVFFMILIIRFSVLNGSSDFIYFQF